MATRTSGEESRSTNNGQLATCLGCGCLCDDITVRAEGGQLVEAVNACPKGLTWFGSALAENDGPAATIDGEPAEEGRALERAAALLAGARRPLIWGLTQTTTEAVREALNLADRIGALVLPERSSASRDALAAFQDLGRVRATLGEVRNRADLIIFWGCDPVSTHPRHAERYSFDAPARFLPGGRSDRTVIVIDDRPNATASFADLVVPLPADRDLDLIAALRWLGQDPAADVGPLAASCGLNSETLNAIETALSRARYGALFYEPRDEDERSVRPEWDGVTAFVRERNGENRFVLMGLGSQGNISGAEAALTWQAGHPEGVDFRLGVPGPVDDTAHLEETLLSGEADALLVVADWLPVSSVAAELSGVPTVVVARWATTGAVFRPAVGFATAGLGAEVTGSVSRCDGVSLPLRSLRTPRFRSDAEWLAAITSKVGR